MTIDLKHTRFSIKPLNKGFGILVHYKNHSFFVFKGNLALVKGKFMQFVNDRRALEPYINYYFNNYVSA